MQTLVLSTGPLVWVAVLRLAVRSVAQFPSIPSVVKPLGDGSRLAGGLRSPGLIAVLPKPLLSSPALSPSTASSAVVRTRYGS